MGTCFSSSSAAPRATTSAAAPAFAPSPSGSSGSWKSAEPAAAPLFADAALGPDAILARASGENFPVASRLLPAAQRRHLLALYGFARLADELGDAATGDRLAGLAALEHDLRRIWAGTPEHPLVVGLADTVRACSLPPEPFLRLIEANRVDQRVSRYATFEDLRGYCALSANPVGELVLRVFGEASLPRIRLSDAVCTGLQLVEHLQDVAEDLSNGRIYLPAEDMDRFGCSEDDLRRWTVNASVRHLVHFEAGRARRLLDEAAPLVATLSGRPRLAVAAFAAGGHAALDAIEARGCDVLRGAPRPRRRDFARRLLRVWRAARGDEAGASR